VTNCNTTQHTVTQRNTLQHTATHCKTLQHTAKHCNTLQERGTYYNHQERHAESSQRHGDFLGEPLTTFASPAHPLGCLCLQCVAVCCSVLQYVVACGSVLQREYVVPYKDPVHKRPIVSFVRKIELHCSCCNETSTTQLSNDGAWSTFFFFGCDHKNTPSYIHSVVCVCILLVCVGVCWCVLVCIAVCCSVLQGVAVICTHQAYLLFICHMPPIYMTPLHYRSHMPCKNTKSTSHLSCIHMSHASYIHYTTPL